MSQSGSEIKLELRGSVLCRENIISSGEDILKINCCRSSCENDSDSRIKTKHTTITDVKPISPSPAASSVPLFIFATSQVLPKNHLGEVIDRAARRIKGRLNRVQYHRQKNNTLL